MFGGKNKKMIFFFTGLAAILGDVVLSHTSSLYAPPARFRRDTGSPSCPPLQPSMDNLTQEEMLSKLTDSCRYDHFTRPPSDDPLRIDFQIDVKHIESVDNTQFKAKIIVQMRFKDQRLAFADLSPKRQNILGEESLKNTIWLPHIVIKNEKDSSLMGLDRKDVIVKILPSGDVIYSYRMTVAFYCWMDLRKFPFDHQLCQITWTSWSYDVNNLELLWVKNKAFFISENLHLTEFALNGLTVDDSHIKSESMDATYSAVTFKFRLERQAGYYILEYFLPSVLLVFMSWVSFWIQVDAAPARTTLGTATMLSFITLNGNLMSNLPKVSYIKASEIWFFGGATFIFCSLAEFAFVNVIWRRRKTVELAKKSSKYIIKGALSPRLARKDLMKSSSFTSLDSKQSGHYLTVHGSSSSLNIPTVTTPPTEDPNGDSTATTPTTPPTWTQMSPQEVAIWIDRKSRVVFPLLFVIYNVFYWGFVYYL